METSNLLIRSALVLGLLGLGGCRAKPSATNDEEAPPSASASAAPTVFLPVEEVAKVVNPTGEPPYGGPISVVRGVVTMTGDEAPVREEVAREIPDKCAGARAVYGRLFREGPGRTTADVLVAVTGYKGYVPSAGKRPRLDARGCAFESRTIGLMFGESLDIVSRDGETYIPEILGQQTKALLVAMPGRVPVQVFPVRVGRTVLLDNAHPFSKADLFVLRFPTFDVTGLDGRFEIERVPLGEMTVSAYLPATGQTVEKKVNVTAGAPIDVALELSFDASKQAPGSASSATPGSSAAR